MTKQSIAKLTKKNRRPAANSLAAALRWDTIAAQGAESDQATSDQAAGDQAASAGAQGTAGDQAARADAQGTAGDQAARAGTQTSPSPTKEQ
jgi:hypothetical protein